MRRLIVVAACAVGMLVVLALVAWSIPTGSWARSMLLAAVVVGSGVGAAFVSRQARGGASGSSEVSDAALRAGNRAFATALVLAAALGLVFLFRHEYVAAVGFYGLFPALTLAYWLNYAYLRRKAR